MAFHEIPAPVFASHDTGALEVMERRPPSKPRKRGQFCFNSASEAASLVRRRAPSDASDFLESMLRFGSASPSVRLKTNRNIATDAPLTATDQRASCLVGTGAPF